MPQAARSAALGTRRWHVMLVGAVLSGGIGAQPPSETSSPLNIDAESGSIGREGSAFSGLRITWENVSLEADEAFAAGLDYETSEWTLQGNVRIGTDLGFIEADEAQGNFTDDEWRFSGNVRIDVGTAVLRADEGRFTFENNRLAAAELTGTPATFEDRGAPELEARGPVRGTADRLHYDVSTQTLRLTDNVTVRAGPNEYSSCDLVYSFEQEAVTSGASGDCDVHIRVQVPSGGDADPPPEP